jgi:pentatricopeptide repeat protein
LQIFKTIKEEHKSAAYRNETGWVLAIEAALKTQNSEAASSIMRDSEDLGIQPTIQLFDALLSHFASTDKVELIEQTLAQMASAGISPSIISTSLTQDIFRAYYKAGRLEEARSMLNKYNPHHHAGPAYLALLGEYCTNIALFTQEFRRLVEESKDGESIPALYSEAIAVLMRHHMVEEAKFLLEEMETQGITPNAPQCAVILKTMIDADAIVKAEDYLKRWRPPPSSPYRETPYLVLVEEYCKQGHEERAMSLINEMQHQHRIAATAPFFHALMQANFAKNKGDNVPALLRRMTSPSSVRPALSPTRDTLRVVVSGFSELRDAAHLTEWWRNLTTHHFVEPERPEWLAYIVGLVKCGEYDLAIAAWSDLLFKVGIDRAGCDLILNTLIEEQLMSATTMKDVKGLLSDKNFTKSTTNSILTAAPAADLGRRFAAWMKNAKRRKIAFAR